MEEKIDPTVLALLELLHEKQNRGKTLRISFRDVLERYYKRGYWIYRSRPLAPTYILAKLRKMRIKVEFDRKTHSFVVKDADLATVLPKVEAPKKITNYVPEGNIDRKLVESILDNEKVPELDNIALGKETQREIRMLTDPRYHTAYTLALLEKLHEEIEKGAKIAIISPKEIESLSRKIEENGFKSGPAGRIFRPGVWAALAEQYEYVETGIRRGPRDRYHIFIKPRKEIVKRIVEELRSKDWRSARGSNLRPREEG